MEKGFGFKKPRRLGESCLLIHPVALSSRILASTIGKPVSPSCHLRKAKERRTEPRVKFRAAVASGDVVGCAVGPSAPDWGAPD